MTTKLSKKLRKSPILIIGELMLGLSASIISLYVFYELATNIDAFHQLDIFITTAVYDLRTPFVTSIMFVVTALGNELMLVLLAIILLMSIVRKHKSEAKMIVVILLVGVVLNLVLKEMIGRARPDISPLVIEQFKSFPSGHAMNAFVFYSTLILYVYRVSRSKLLTLVSAVINGVIIFSIGISRIYLGVHYPSDVIAGFVAGFWWITTALVIEKTLFLLKNRSNNAT